MLKLKLKQGGLGLMVSLILAFFSNAFAAGALSFGSSPDPGRNAAIWKAVMRPIVAIPGIMNDVIFIPEPTIVNNAPALAEMLAVTGPACGCSSGEYSLMDAMMVPIATMMSDQPVEKIDALNAWEMAQRGELQMINSLPKGGYARFHFPGEIVAPVGADLIELMDSGKISKDKWVAANCP